MSNKELDKFIHRNIDKIIEWQIVINDMLDEPHKYGYADDTLRSILYMMEETGDITGGQIRAVENIRAKPTRKNVRYGYRKRY